MLRSRIYLIISIPVFLYLYAYTAIMVFLALILAHLRWKRGTRQLIILWAKSIFPLMGKRLHITGRTHIDKGKRYILLANHASMFDIIAIMSVHPNVVWFGHERLLRIPLFKQMLLMTDYVPMQQSNVTNTRKMIQSLEEKSSHSTVAIFPEGTRTLNGKLNSFYRGFIYLLRASENDILPVTLNGFYQLKPKNRFGIHFNTRLEAVIHPPMNGSILARESDQFILDKVSQIIESANKERI